LKQKLFIYKVDGEMLLYYASEQLLANSAMHDDDSYFISIFHAKVICFLNQLTF
jgi:hypothetical protein